jgi:hypothetical protein
MLWLFLTAQMPTAAQISDLSRSLRDRARDLPRSVLGGIIDSMPESSHPMAQLACAVTALQSRSRFAGAYAAGLSTGELWRPAMEDCLDLIAYLPILAAYIYRRSFIVIEGNKARPKRDPEEEEEEADDRRESRPEPRSSSCNTSSDSAPAPRSSAFDLLDLAAASDLDLDLDLAARFCKMLGFDSSPQLPRVVSILA